MSENIAMSDFADLIDTVGELIAAILNADLPMECGTYRPLT